MAGSLTAGPFLDQAGLDALVGHIQSNGGFVVNEGVSGMWHYTKYSTGMAIIRGRLLKGWRISTNQWASTGDGTYYKEYGYLSLPFELVDAADYIGVFEVNNLLVWYGSGDYEKTNKKIYFRAITSVKPSWIGNIDNLQPTILVIGRWK